MIACGWAPATRSPLMTSPLFYHPTSSRLLSSSCPPPSPLLVYPPLFLCCFIFFSLSNPFSFPCLVSFPILFLLHTPPTSLSPLLIPLFFVSSLVLSLFPLYFSSLPINTPPPLLSFPLVSNSISQTLFRSYKDSIQFNRPHKVLG